MLHTDEMKRFCGIDCDKCPGGDACKRVAGSIPFLPKLTGCPRTLIRDGRFQAVLRLYNLKTVAPLEGWPSKYSAWAQSGIIGLEGAIGEKQTQDQTAARLS